MARYADYKDQIDTLVELAEPYVYDGWSIAILKDGTKINRWENDEGTGPEPGYERRYALVQKVLDAENLQAAHEAYSEDAAVETSRGLDPLGE